MFVGLDVHKEFCQAAFVNAKGKVVKRERFDNTLEGREKLAKALKGSEAVLESSGSTLPVYDALRKTCKVKVAHPSKVKAIASARIKTDKIDAEILAQLLRADLIPESYVPSYEYRQARLAVRHRVDIVKMRTQVKNRVRCLLAREGIKAPVKDVFSKKGLAFLRSVELAEQQRYSLDSLLFLLETFETKIAEVDEQIENMASQNSYAQILKTHPGVGCFSALLVASEIGEIERFPSYKKLCSYFGLVPSVYQSGSTERKGHITKQGSNLARWVLIQCAQNAVRCSRRFEKKYKRLERRIGARRAIVAIARLIAVDMYFMLVKNEPYREQGRKTRESSWSARPYRRLGSSPPHDSTPCDSPRLSTNRRMS